MKVYEEYSAYNCARFFHTNTFLWLLGQLQVQPVIAAGGVGTVELHQPPTWIGYRQHFAVHLLYLLSFDACDSFT